MNNAKMVTMLALGLVAGSACAADANVDGNGAGHGGTAVPAAEESAPDAGPAAETSAAEAAGSAAEAVTGEFEEVMAHDWTIDAGAEQYYCVYKTLTEDLWVSEFRPLASPGTHHVTLGFQEPGPPDGAIEAGDPNSPVPCNGLTFGDVLAFTGTVGTQPLSLPAGVATKIPGGKQLVLGVHVFNATEHSLSGRTGVEVVRPDPSSVVHEAEQILAFDPNLEVPPGRSTQTATCTMQADATIFAALPHMHKTGVHMKSTAVPADGDPVAVLDTDYQFDNQVYETLDPPVQLRAGDKLEVQCEFENPGDAALKFGESTVDNEMCVTIFYRYPAVGTSATCWE